LPFAFCSTAPAAPGSDRWVLTTSDTVAKEKNQALVQGGQFNCNMPEKIEKNGDRVKGKAVRCHLHSWLLRQVCRRVRAARSSRHTSPLCAWVCIALTTASMPPVLAILVWFSARKLAKLRRALHPTPCTSSLCAWVCMALTTASMPPALVILRSASSTIANFCRARILALFAHGLQPTSPDPRVHRPVDPCVTDVVS